MQKFVFKQININHIYWLYAIWLILNVSFALSPSSYGMALDAFGIDYNTVFGLPRPIRSDEWAVWTPYTQMAVNNDFERYYQSGLYQIDLRNFNQIPLLDWSLVFKPLIWGYFILPALRLHFTEGLFGRNTGGHTENTGGLLRYSFQPAYASYDDLQFYQ